MNAKYPLKDLLKVRQFREDRAAKELTRCRLLLEQALEELEKRINDIEDYRTWRKKRENELYQEVIEQEVQLKDLDGLKQEIQLLREKEVLLEQRIAEARDAVKQATETRDEAHANHQKSDRDVQKIEEHREMWAQEMAKEDQLLEDKEMEDFRVRQQEQFESENLDE